LIACLGSRFAASSSQVAALFVVGEKSPSGTQPNLSANTDSVVSKVVESYLREQAARDASSSLREAPDQDDVEKLIVFYHSPVGKKLASVTPAISFESAKVGQQWVASLMPGLQVRLAEALKNEK
jgi:hypothetical protein